MQPKSESAASRLVRGKPRAQRVNAGVIDMASASRPSQDVRRAEMLEAAAFLFSTRGFHATGMRDLAQHLDIKAGSLYYHINSKEDLLGEICSIGVDKLIGNIDHAMGGGESLAATIRSIMVGHVWLIRRYGHFLHCYENENKHMAPAVALEIEEKLRLFHRRIDSVFLTAIENGETIETLNVKYARRGVVAFLAHLVRLDQERGNARLDEIALGLADILNLGFARR